MQIASELESDKRNEEGHDSSTTTLMERYRKQRVELAWVAPNPEEVAFRAATTFVEAARRAVFARDRFNVALSGGETPRATYELLATHAFNQQMDSGKIHLYWVDERCVPPDDPRASYQLAFESWSEYVFIPAENIHRMRGELDPETAAREYENDLPDRFDLIWLGLGETDIRLRSFPGNPLYTKTQGGCLP